MFFFLLIFFLFVCFLVCLFVCLFGWLVGWFLCFFVCFFVGWQQKVGGTGAVGATAFSLAPARSEGRADSMFSYCPGEPRLRCWHSKGICLGGM